MSNKAESLTLKNLHCGGGNHNNKNILGNDMCYAENKTRPYNKKGAGVGEGMASDETFDL